MTRRGDSTRLARATMPISDYVKRLRAYVGTDVLLMPAVTAIVRDPNGRILLVKTIDRGVWVAPGGSIDPGESPTDAVVRETWEETGLVVEPRALVGVYGGPEFLISYPNGDRTAYVTTVFECAAVGGAPRADGVETSELRYVAAADLAALPVAAWVPVVLADAFRFHGQARFQALTWRPPR